MSRYETYVLYCKEWLGHFLKFKILWVYSRTNEKRSKKRTRTTGQRQKGWHKKTELNSKRIIIHDALRIQSASAIVQLEIVVCKEDDYFNHSSINNSKQRIHSRKNLEIMFLFLRNVQKCFPILQRSFNNKLFSTRKSSIINSR